MIRGLKNSMNRAWDQLRQHRYSQLPQQQQHEAINNNNNVNNNNNNNNNSQSNNTTNSLGNNMDENGAMLPPPPPTQKSCFQVSTSVILFASLLIGMLVLCREYLGQLILWMSELSGWYSPILFGLLFVIASLPMMFGYMALNLGAGYLYGMWVGLAVTVVGASTGGMVSFLFCRFLWKDYVTKKISQYENLQQIVRVIEGRHGFRIIMMTRLTPIPYGMQNALLSTAKVTKLRYGAATALGLLPTQVLNTYMGTTLRTMEDVLAGKTDNLFVIIFQVVVAFVVSYLVNQKMRKEISKAVAEQQLNDVRPGETETSIELVDVRSDDIPLSSSHGSNTSLSSLIVKSSTGASTHGTPQRMSPIPSGGGGGGSRFNIATTNV